MTLGANRGINGRPINKEPTNITTEINVDPFKDENTTQIKEFISDNKSQINKLYQRIEAIRQLDSLLGRCYAVMTEYVSYSQLSELNDGNDYEYRRADNGTQTSQTSDLTYQEWNNNYSSNLDYYYLDKWDNYYSAYRYTYDEDKNMLTIECKRDVFGHIEGRYLNVQCDNLNNILYDNLDTNAINEFYQFMMVTHDN